MEGSFLTRLWPWQGRRAALQREKCERRRKILCEATEVHLRWIKRHGRHECGQQLCFRYYEMLTCDPQFAVCRLLASLSKPISLPRGRAGRGIQRDFAQLASDVATVALTLEPSSPLRDEVCDALTEALVPFDRINLRTTALLRLAASCGHAALMRTFLTRGVPVDTRHGGRTALRHLADQAIFGGQVEKYSRVAALLLDAGASLYTSSPRSISVATFLRQIRAWGTLQLFSPAGQLQRAALDGDHGRVRSLLVKGAGVNVADGEGNASLHYAVKAKNPSLRLIALLLACGANPRARNGEGETPFDLAKRLRKRGLLEMLKAGDEPGDECVHRLASSCWLTPLRAFAEMEGAEQLDRNSCTPLHYAALLGRAPACATLTTAGASPNRQDRWGVTPLHLAALWSGLSGCLFWFLVEQGGDPELATHEGLRPREVYRYAAGASKTTARREVASGCVPKAAARGDVGRILSLVTAGQPVDEYNERGQSGIRSALEAGQLYGAAVLITMKTCCDGCARLSLGDQKLAQTRRRQDPSAASWLLFAAMRRGARASCRRRLIAPPERQSLSQECEPARADTKLLGKGGEPGKRSVDTSDKQRLRLTRALMQEIEGGRLLEKIDAKGRTGLHLACLLASQGALRRQLPRGALVVADVHGVTPAHLAALDSDESSELLFDLLAASSKQGVQFATNVPHPAAIRREILRRKIDHPAKRRERPLKGLHSAAADDDLGLLLTLYCEGARLDALDRFGKTALQRAIGEGARMAAAALLSLGATCVHGPGCEVLLRDDERRADT